MTIDNNKMEALNEALKKIEKEHGKGSVMKLMDQNHQVRQL